jgi:hypothetical protein
MIPAFSNNSRTCALRFETEGDGKGRCRCALVVREDRNSGTQKETRCGRVPIEKMGGREGKEGTHDLSPKPAMVKEQFWQERTSREVATRQFAKSAS